MGAPWPCSPRPAPPRRRPSPGSRAPRHLAAARSAPQGDASSGVRSRRVVVPLRHARLLAGRGRPGPLPVVGDDRPPALPATRRPALAGPSRPAGGGAFSLVDLPRAATLLAQGAGRLIRTIEDRGVVAVLDPRLATASYHGVLLATLPPMRRSVDFEEVQSFFDGRSEPTPGRWHSARRATRRSRRSGALRVACALGRHPHPQLSTRNGPASRHGSASGVPP